jgi:hypothetical protein
LRGQFGRYWFYNSLRQPRDFGLHVEPRSHHFRSFRPARDDYAG